jgi:hypothetical protein
MKLLNSVKNKYIFFLLRIYKDFFNPTTYKISQEKHSEKLGEYYFLFKETQMKNQKGGQRSIVFDENGIPVNPTYIDVKDKKYVYFPITIGQVGLAIFNTYTNSKSENDKKRFMNIVDWFYKNVTLSDDLGALWLTEVALPQYKNKGPWQSAFSQSRAISVLLRGYQITKDKKYAELAEKALIPFTKAVDDGGVTSYTEWGAFYEEYTSTVPTLVLNGMIFSLCGIYDFVRVFPNNKIAKELFEQGIKTIVNILPEFDLGYWSRYNLCTAAWHPDIDPATITYQKLHVTQLQMLYELTGEDIFRKYVEIFSKQDRLINVLKMYYVKYKSLKKMGRL